LAGGKLRQANADLWVARIVTNAADPFDSPEQSITGEVVNRVDGIHHPQIIAMFALNFAKTAGICK
jgi:hypothetical protein